MGSATVKSLLPALAIASVSGCVRVDANTRNAPEAPTPLRHTLVRPPPVETATLKATVRAVSVDSDMSEAEALGTNQFPREVLDRMELIDVEYWGFDGAEHRGQIVIDRGLAVEVRQIFSELREAHFPIEKVVPISHYRWNDGASMADNNTSGFNYRRVETAYGRGRSLSKHSFGRAIDLNPRVNPMTTAERDSKQPYDPEAKGALTNDSRAVRIFRAHGWQWGGAWRGGKDYQHFVKP